MRDLEGCPSWNLFLVRLNLDSVRNNNVYWNTAKDNLARISIRTLYTIRDEFVRSPYQNVQFLVGWPEMASGLTVNQLIKFTGSSSLSPTTKVGMTHKEDWFNIIPWWDSGWLHLICNQVPQGHVSSNLTHGSTISLRECGEMENALDLKSSVQTDLGVRFPPFLH